MSGSLVSSSQLVAMCVGGFALGAGLAHLFSAYHQPKGTRYGSQWHALQHRWGSWTGHVGHVRLVAFKDGEEPKHTKAFGLVCHTCGYVSVNRFLSDDNEIDGMVQDEIGNRSTTGFTWTLL